MDKVMLSFFCQVIGIILVIIGLLFASSVNPSGLYVMFGGFGLIAIGLVIVLDDII